MAEIQLERETQPGGYAFRVTVSEQSSQTRHRVTLSENDYQRLSGGRASPEALVEESFHFLLERESKESILRSFDLTVISRYFPEYEREISRRL
ncbi:MAG: hypothetical protein PVI59_12950 [Anaerolineae bacterium]